MIAAVMGVPGAGKSTVIDIARRYVSVDVINYGDVFLEVARERLGIVDRDEIRRQLTADAYESLHREAARRIRERLRGPTLLDTHALVALKTGFMPGFPDFVLDSLPISLFVLVEAEPEEIVARRERDKRERGGGLEDNVALHQELNRAAAVCYAVKKGGSVYIIKNREGRAEEAGRELAEVLREWIRGLQYRR